MTDIASGHDDGALTDMANAIRMLSVEAVEAAQSGHPGMPLGMADLATVLFSEVLKYDAKAPDWPDRDRFVLSNGHGSMLLYSALYLSGYPGMALDDIRRFRQIDSLASGHPERNEPPGVETTTGPLGQGVANAVGMALAERLLNASFGDDLVDHRTYAFCGDGCLMEGVAQEAISLAGHMGLSKLTLIFDDNSTTIDGATSISTSDDHLARFRASGWEVMAIDGHDLPQIRAAFGAAQASDRPVLIAAKTRIGFGAPTKEGKSVAHGAPLGRDEIDGLRRALGWTAPAFEIPEDILTNWRAAGVRGQAQHVRWRERLNSVPANLRAAFQRRQTARLPDGLEAAVQAAIEDAVQNPEAQPVRKASQAATGVIFGQMPELVGGSADLTGSVLSLAPGMRRVTPGDFDGSHLSYGVREHAMAAAMNGMAAHGGLRPYGATYLTFCDYCRPAIRLAAMMKLRVTFVFSHDSIGVGEDGPTHQPIEQVVSLRAIPGLRVYRPADAVETLECWLDALSADGPSAMILSRQKTPAVRQVSRPDMPARRGGYVLAEPDGARDATILATGTEVALAMDVRDRLAQAGLSVAVVSMPSTTVFDREPRDYRDNVLGDAPRFSIEAGSTQGWSDYTGQRDNAFGLDRFGLSAPGPEVFERMGLTAERIADEIRAKLAR